MPKKKPPKPVNRIPFLARFEPKIYEALRKGAYKERVSMNAIVQACVAECLEVKN